MPGLGSNADDGAVREPVGGGAPATLVLRELTSHADLHEVERIQREVWGLDDLEVVPNSQLRAALHAGGQLGGAFQEGVLVGFSYGFLASPHGRLMVGPGLHSHMVAVRAGARGLGVGQALKWQQRAWCLERGIAWMTWTFDPLQTRNANLNLRHLGAIGVDYLVDFYGPMGGPLGGGRSDRLLALWLLAGQRVTAIAEGGRPHGPAVGARSATAARQRLATWAVRAASSEGDAEPVVELSGEPLARTAETGARVMVSAPPAPGGAAAPERARRWQDAFVRTVVPLLEAGYVAVDFAAGAYVLEPAGEGCEAEPTNL